jgi:hypothetical protein
MKRPVRRIKRYDQGGDVDEPKPIDPGPTVSDRVKQSMRQGMTLARIGQLYAGGGSSGAAPQSPTAGTDLGGLYRRGGKVKKTLSVKRGRK